jgi:putative addiction module killer protein
MYEVQLTEEFEAWLAGLRDRSAQMRVVARIRRISLGNLGDWRSVHGALSEIRIDHGAGYRLYFVRRGAEVILLLAGGDKSTQRRDIKRATELLKLLDAEL